MTKREIIEALMADEILLAMVATEIGESVLAEANNDDATYFDIARAALVEMLAWPLDDVVRAGK